MKKTFKGYILGFLTAAILVSGVTYASNTVKIVIDGRELVPTDADGNRVDPIIIDGTTYLPVRAIANAFDKAVYWDGPNSTVYLGKMNGKLEYPTAKLEDVPSISDKDETKKLSTLTDNYGHKYTTSYGTDWQWSVYHALLQGKYSKFKGTLYVPENTTSDVVSTMFIEVDGKTVYTSPDMTKTSRPVDIEIDISNANEFKISYTQTGGYNFFGYNLCLGDAGFYQ